MAEREGTGGRVPVGIDPARGVPRTSGLDTRIGRWRGQTAVDVAGRVGVPAGADRGLGADAHRGFGRPPMRDATLRSTAADRRDQHQRAGQLRWKEAVERIMAGAGRGLGRPLRRDANASEHRA